MNRREFFKVALALGCAGLGATVVPSEPKATARIYPYAPGLGNTILSLPSATHTHSLDAYSFELSQHTHSLEDVLDSYTRYKQWEALNDA